MPGNRQAAVEAYRRLGEVAGDAIAQALTLIDGLVVIGGGVAGASRLFLPALVDALNDVYHKESGPLRRLIARAFNFEEADQREQFLRGETREIIVPGSSSEGQVRSASADSRGNVAPGHQRGRGYWGLCLCDPQTELLRIGGQYQLV